MSFNPLFYVSKMRQCIKSFPAKFQSRPTFLAEFFSKRVADDDDRKKTFFLASRGEQSSSGFVYTSPDRSRYPDVWISAPDRPSVYTKCTVRYPAHNATLSGADRKRFQRWIISECPGGLRTCVNGASGY